MTQLQSAFERLWLTQDGPVQTEWASLFVLLQLQRTSFCQFGPVWGKERDRGNRLQSGSSRLGQKTGPSWTFKHYSHVPAAAFTLLHTSSPLVPTPLQHTSPTLLWHTSTCHPWKVCNHLPHLPPHHSVQIHATSATLSHKLVLVASLLYRYIVLINIFLDFVALITKWKLIWCDYEMTIIWLWNDYRLDYEMTIKWLRDDQNHADIMQEN